MSANKKVKYSLRSCDRLNTRKSFDRFGDDLCEEILQYLSFSEKIRFECVSKLFTRCVYQRQYELETYDKYNSKINARNSLPIKKLYAYPKRVSKKSQNDVRITNFECVLKKCPKINCIELLTLNKESNLDDVMRIITDNCNHLKKITVNSDRAFGVEISGNVLNDFGVKFGKTLQEIRFGMSISTDFDRLLKFCPNVVSLCNIYVEYLISDDISLSKLREFNNLRGYDDLDSMDKFVAKYRNTIKVFCSKYDAYNVQDEYDEYDGESYIALMSHVSKFTNLDILVLQLVSVNLLDLCNGLKLLAVNPKLKVLKLHLLDHDEESGSTELFKLINHFTQLKSLELSSINTTTESVELIKNCKQLNEIAVRYIYGDEFFKDIDKIFSKLKNIRIQCETITDETFNYFANLEHLRVIDVTTHHDCLITHTAICNVIEKCKNLREFNFYTCPQITVQTIQVLFEIALNRPHIRFDHFFGDCSQKYHKLIYSSVKRYGLPSNLKVSYRYGSNWHKEKTIKYPPDSNSGVSHY